MSDTDKKPLIVALIAAACIGPAALVALPGAASLREAKLESQTPAYDEAELDAAKVAVEALRTQTWPAVQSAAAELSARVPESEARGDRLLLIERAAKAEDVLIRASRETASTQTPSRGYLLSVIEVSAEGTFDALSAFVDRMESSPRLVSVEDAEFRRDPEGGLKLLFRGSFVFPIRVGAADPTSFPSFAELESR